MTVEKTSPLCLPLAADEAPLQLVGGKGASLARMAAAGLAVPPGFHLTTAAYRSFVAANDLLETVVATATGARADDPASLNQASATIQALFQSGAVPEAVATAIRQAYAALGGSEPPVAVRSSATAEDLPGLSFAGLQETYLNVRGQDALLDAVRRCWGSLWTARAIGYRLRMGIDQRAVAMGVVVQVMVPSEVSGVLFTANPTTGERDELVLNASYGLGEAVVSGRVTPDSFVLDTASLALKATVPGTKGMMVVAADGQGTTTEAVSEARQREQVLSAHQLRELGELARRVEQLFGGFPQDIEWAVAQGGFWLLQARPMTGLPTAPLRDVRWESPIPGARWVRRQVVENMPDPLSPLFDELYLREGLGQFLDALQAAMDVPESLNELVQQPLFTTVQGFAYMRGDIRTTWKTIPLFISAVATGIPRMFRRGIPYWRDEVLPTYLAAIERWKTLDPRTLPDEQLLQGVRELARAEATYWSGVTMALGVAKVSDVVFDRFLAVAMPGRGLTSGLFLRGFPSKALEAEAELEAIAEHVRGSDGLRALVAGTTAQRLLEVLGASPGGRPVRDELRRYLERFGHQIYSLDFAAPTLAENPLPVLLSLKARVQQPSDAVGSRQSEMARERDRLTERTLSSLDPLRRRLFRGLLAWAQRLGPYREEALFYVGSAWPALRALALELGRRLAEAGSLASPDDVFFLDSSELLAASAARMAGRARPDLAKLAQERRELREARKRLHPPATVPPGIVWKLGPFDLSARMSQRWNAPQGPTLRGFAVSPGRVTAPASVILSPTDFDQMQPGSILVCPTTTPAWTLLFAQARGLVTDIGGVAAHGSIIAREYGIPAVMGTGNGTQRISTGQSVTVDGDAGTVTLLPPGAGQNEQAL